MIVWMRWNIAGISSLMRFDFREVILLGGSEGRTGGYKPLRFC